ncbi:hypothetical protein AL036_06180 [Salipiger aestuarii]|uniref:DUF2125 domain-containing protein n=1 Tax=Salipiger aestuarii TaxID=568098 RepID=UPI00123B5A59|nr:DUF2125 domain-containing protein [Salipiger aestuarii]KAA8608688.1 hypothetical protein AL036_06180 [Salipiger aestuarii]
MLVSKQGLALAACALTVAHPALADITPDQVWHDLETYFQSFGYEVRATESRTSGALRLSDVALRMALPEGEGEIRAQIGEMLLAPAGDAVTISLPARFPLVMTLTPTGEDEIETVDMTYEVALGDPEMTVSGAPDDTTWDYSFATMGLSLSELIVDGDVLGQDAARFAVAAGPVAGRSRMELVDGLRDIAQTVRFGDVTFDLSGSDPGADPGTGGTFAGAVGGLTAENRTRLPQGTPSDDMAALLNAGFDASGTLAWTDSQTVFAVTEARDEATGRTSSGAGTMDFAMSPDGMTYDLDVSGVEIEVTPQGMPFPLAAGMDRIAMNLGAPVSAAQAPQDIALGLTLGGASLSEAIWGMIDPQAMLPRDPATIVLDMTGKVTPYTDLFDPEALAKLETGNVRPGEINALTLNSLTAEAAGARLTGEGAFTFDNTDLDSFDGLPAPEGEVNLRLVGANALIDKLMALGAVDQAQAMGARMMLGMFAVPGDAEDSLTSTIRVNKRGQILANGQRIK